MGGNEDPRASAKSENSQLLLPSSSDEVDLYNKLSSRSSASEDFLSYRSTYDENAGEAVRQSRFLHRHVSSFRRVLESFSKSEREEALRIEGVGPAAFLIRDAVLGEVENPAEGPYGDAEG